MLEGRESKKERGQLEEVGWESDGIETKALLINIKREKRKAAKKELRPSLLSGGCKHRSKRLIMYLSSSTSSCPLCPHLSPGTHTRIHAVFARCVQVSSEYRMWACPMWPGLHHSTGTFYTSPLKQYGKERDSLHTVSKRDKPKCIFYDKMNHSSKQCTELPVEKRWITNDLQDVSPFCYSIFINLHPLIALSPSFILKMPMHKTADMYPQTQTSIYSMLICHF